MREDHKPDHPDHRRGGPKVHFDLQGYDLLYWSPSRPDHFRKQLEKRIRRRLEILAKREPLTEKSTQGIASIFGVGTAESEVPPAAAPEADANEIGRPFRRLSSTSREVRKDAGRELLDLARRKRILHDQDVRMVLPRLLKDVNEDVRLLRLDIITTVLTSEREVAGKRYTEPLRSVAETDQSLVARGRAMAAIGATGDARLLPAIYQWIESWDDNTFAHVNPVVALQGLAHHGLGEEIREDLRDHLKRDLPAGIQERLAGALREINQATMRAR